MITISGGFINAEIRVEKEGLFLRSCRTNFVGLTVWGIWVFFLKSSYFSFRRFFGGRTLSSKYFQKFLGRVKEFLPDLNCFKFDQTLGKSIEFSQKWVLSEICGLKKNKKSSNLNPNLQKKRANSHSFWISQQSWFRKKSSQNIKKRLQH